MQAPQLEGKKTVIVSIMRPGDGILNGMIEIIPSARVGHIGLYRDPPPLDAVQDEFKAPSELPERNALLVDPRRPEVKVHHGFLSAFRSVESLIRADLDANVPETLGLYITGHSLGGALAQIASAAFARDSLAACYSFGSPRVGGMTFDYEVKCPHYRVVNAWDLVPAIPPPLWRGYLHGGDVRTLRRKGERPLRRNRLVIDAALKTLIALVIYPFSRRLFLVDDHMIGNYRDKLDVIAAERGRSPG